MRRPLLLLIWTLHGVAVYHLVMAIGPGGFALVILPTALTAWYGGLRGGLLGALGGICVNTLANNLLSEEAFDPLISLHEGGWPGLIVTLVVAAVVGYLRDLRVRFGAF